MNVPELGEADLRAMRSGVLPSSTAAGDALGWAARDLTGLKVGLALGAGSIRGYAHVGVIETLHRAGVPIDYIAGTSIGSAVAGLYALGKDDGDRRDARRVRPEPFKLTIPFRSLLSNRGMRRYMQMMAPTSASRTSTGRSRSSPQTSWPSARSSSSADSSGRPC